MNCSVCKKSELAIRNDNLEIVCPACGCTFIRASNSTLMDFEKEKESGKVLTSDSIKFRWKLGWVLALALALVYVKTGYELSKAVHDYQQTVTKCKDLVMQVGQLKVELDDISKTAIRLMDLNGLFGKMLQSKDDR